MNEWITTDPATLGWIFISTLGVYGVIILYCRVVGLRSFSKMSAPDFAMTVAVGSLFASTIANPSPTLFSGIFALGILFAGQWTIAFLRRRFNSATTLLDNAPLLLMRNGELITENLTRANITKSDVMAKLREANAFRLSSVKAVIFESTGDISVIHSDRPSDVTINEEIVKDVIGWDKSSLRQHG